MNNLIQLKGQFQTRQNDSTVGPANIPAGKSVEVIHVEKLARQLEEIKKYWENDKTIDGALISVHYRGIVAKSNRVRIILMDGGKVPNDSIVGAKFNWEKNSENKVVQKHVFTHYLSTGNIDANINKLKKASSIMKKHYGETISQKQIEDINKGKFSFQELSKSAFTAILTDAYYVEYFTVDKVSEEIVDDSLVTLYKTVDDTKALLRKLGIDITNAKMVDDTTLRLSREEIGLLIDKVPYLIAMSVTDFSQIPKVEIIEGSQEYGIGIPSPTSEPVVGVIDTQFDEKVYFHEWVEYKNMLSEDIPLSQNDYFHGTAVSSIIVDGPSFNPHLDDGCGRFRVRHFGVATSTGFSSFLILKMIRGIVANNRDIKVWNLSLGSVLEIKPSYISPEAAELDRIQCEYDVIFVVAGTNDPHSTGEMKIGAPADSLNSLIVNSVDFRGNPATYTRKGPVLSFFNKPDVSYFGGDKGEGILACGSLGGEMVTGTSFAAPWISRKMAYLIQILGLSREIAKALIIDSAAGWNRKDDTSHEIGFGVVPQRIEDVVKSRNDEIRFFMTGSIEEYETFTYNIPIPQNEKGHPFFARATLVYFPKCDRNQGVDYTCTEMDLKLGRIREDANGKIGIRSINKNTQADEGLHVIYEEDARKMYRKWDNVKVISETLKDNGRPRKVYGAGLWGLSIKTKERMIPKAGRGLHFGVVVTLREMEGVNRLDDFISMCQLRGWIVNTIDIQNQIDIYQQAEEEIEFE